MPKSKPKKINLALQGGGAHGAFTWGVLDALCEDGRLEIDGISATSAGAMNAAVYTAGRMENGLDGARQKLHDFWEDISDSGRFFSPIQPTYWEEMMGKSNFGYMWFENFTKMFSPYDYNPLNVNPLRDVLLHHVDFDKIHTCKNTKLFICATNVRTNKLRIFVNEEATCDAVLASACLPTLFQAIEIDGEAYWDGGYIANPAVYPLIYHTLTDDILAVIVNPIERKEIPKKPEEIFARLNEISFNASFLHELRTIEFVKRIVEEEWIKPEYRDHFNFKKLRMHAIGADGEDEEYQLGSKLSPNWQFLCNLRDKGREAAFEWLDQHFSDVGKCSSVDIKEAFLEDTEIDAAKL